MAGRLKVANISTVPLTRVKLSEAVHKVSLCESPFHHRLTSESKLLFFGCQFYYFVFLSPFSHAWWLEVWINKIFQNYGVGAIRSGMNEHACLLIYWKISSYFSKNGIYFTQFYVFLNFLTFNFWCFSPLKMRKFSLLFQNFLPARLVIPSSKKSNLWREQKFRKWCGRSFKKSSHVTLTLARKSNEIQMRLKNCLGRTTLTSMKNNISLTLFLHIKRDQTSTVLQKKSSDWNNFLKVNSFWKLV